MPRQRKRRHAVAIGRPLLPRPRLPPPPRPTLALNLQDESRSPTPPGPPIQQCPVRRDPTNMLAARLSCLTSSPRRHDQIYSTAIYDRAVALFIRRVRPEPRSKLAEPVHLPVEYSSWKGVYTRLRNCAIDGTWERVFTALLAQADAERETWTGSSRSIPQSCEPIRARNTIMRASPSSPVVVERGSVALNRGRRLVWGRGAG